MADAQDRANKLMKEKKGVNLLKVKKCYGCLTQYRQSGKPEIC
jgi:hypothetical protein